MLKRCEECGYEYSSLADKCPNCYFPNRHIQKHIDLLLDKEEAKDSIARSVFCILLFLVSIFVLHKFVGMNMDASIVFGAFFASLMTSMRIGIIGIFIFVFVMSYISNKVPCPKLFDQISILFVYTFPIYYMLVRPVLKIIRILKINKTIDDVHTKDVKRSNDYFWRQVRTVNENTPSLDKNAIDADFTEYEEVKK